MCLGDQGRNSGPGGGIICKFTSQLNLFSFFLETSKFTHINYNYYDLNMF